MRINGPFNQHTYLNFLNELPDYLERHFDDGLVHFLHDNHTCHSTDLIKDWFYRNVGNYQDIVIPHPR